MDEHRLALRRLRTRPGTALVSMVTLACSIGAAAATWSLVSAVLLEPLPVREPDRLMVVGRRVTTGPQAGSMRTGHTYPFFPQLRDGGIFERTIAEWAPPLQLLASTGSLPIQTRFAFVSHDYFDVLGVPVPLGRTFTADDDRRGAAPVAVLTDRYWRLTFDGSPDVLGRTITVSGKPATIVGVASRGFRGLNLAVSPDVYLPFHTIGDVGGASMNFFAEAGHGSAPTAGVTIVGRLPEGVSMTQAEGRVGPELFGLVDVNTHAVPAAARGDMRQFSRLLASTVTLLLLIGCGTVGMLLLLRTEARREELAVCLALGASRAQLARGIAIEGALLALGGALLALPVASWLFNSARAFQLPGGVDIGLLELSMDMRVMAGAIAAAVTATLLIAVVAAGFGFAANLTDALRSSPGSTQRLSRRGTRTALVAGQVAIAMVLLAGAGLFARSLVAALGLNPALATARIVSTDVSLGPYGYNAARAGAFFDDLLGRLAGNPAIASMALSNSMGGMTPAGSFVIDGLRRQFPSTVGFVAVDDRYFDTIGIAVIEGRDFAVDDREASPRVAIVSESFGRMVSNGGSPIGRLITMPFYRMGQAADVMQVVGVVPDIITTITIAEPLVMYLPLSQHPGGTSRTVTMLAAAHADDARREVMGAVRQIDPSLSAGPMLTMDERIGRQMGAQRFGGNVLGALGIIALLLTVLGSYVVAESMAVRRMREMGIRAALGARGGQLAALVLAETGRLVGIGLLAGLLLAWLGANTIRAFLFLVTPLDPLVLGGAAILILTLALGVSVQPARRVARVDLGRVLKEG
jgi:putative ABC transport system permease protein